MQDVVGSVYLRMALCGLEPSHNKLCAIWKVLEAGLAFVDSMPSPVLRPVKAGLMATKAIVSLVTMAAEKDCRPDELFASSWTWKAPEEDKELKFEKKTVPHSSLLKEPKNVHDKTKEAKKVKVAKPKIQVTSHSAKGKVLVPMTPTIKSKSSVRELGSFDFNTVVPTLTCTPVQKPNAPTSVRKAPRTASKLQFHVFEELSPTQDQALPVPDAPRRTKKSRFKVSIYSDQRFDC